MKETFVSVVTPFHNTAPYLAECIESVLAQTFPCFEYILVDNCSTDDSGKIAETYARRDRRIRVIRRPQLLSQVQNYNAALQEISRDSQYCKIVQADDFIFPDCLRLMVEAFERSANIGLVSAYDLKGGLVRGSGFPYHSTPICGREVVRLYFRTGIFVFGSPTTVMYRSSLVRSGQPFYDESLLHEDTEKCIQILKDWDFGFVRQVLSFLRVDSESITGTAREFSPNTLDRYIVIQRYASAFADPKEAEAIKKRVKREYYRALGDQILRLRAGSEFWNYHRNGLKSLGEQLDSPYLALQIAGSLLWAVLNPGASISRLLGYSKRRISKSAYLASIVRE